MLSSCKSSQSVVESSCLVRIYGGIDSKGAPLVLVQITEVQCTVLRYVYAGLRVECRSYKEERRKR